MGSRWVIGDIHGCIATFRSMVEEEIRLQPDDTLYLLGDLIDRGPDSKAVIDYIFHLRELSFSVDSVIGNHEWMLLQAGRSETDFILWMGNSGMTTLKNFGIIPDDFHMTEALKRIPPRYMDFLKMLPFYIETEGFLLVHAGLNANHPRPLEDTRAMLWTRDEEYNEDYMKGRKLIHGHTPLPVKEIRKRADDENTKILNIDGGCVYRQYPGFGHLVALNLDSGAYRILKNLE